MITLEEKGTWIDFKNMKRWRQQDREGQILNYEKERNIHLQTRRSDTKRKRENEHHRNNKILPAEIELDCQLP